jgi:hypothetical protein
VLAALVLCWLRWCCAGCWLWTLRFAAATGAPHPPPLHRSQLKLELRYWKQLNEWCGLPSISFEALWQRVGGGRAFDGAEYTTCVRRLRAVGGGCCETLAFPPRPHPKHPPPTKQPAAATHTAPRSLVECTVRATARLVPAGLGKDPCDLDFVVE